MSEGWMTLRARGDQWLHDNVHVYEMHDIANQELDKREEELLKRIEQIIDEVAERVIGSYQGIVRTCVKISFKDGKDILEDERTQEIVSRAIVDAFKDELHKQLNSIMIK